jgi:hypothetical protein
MRGFALIAAGAMLVCGVASSAAPTARNLQKQSEWHREMSPDHSIAFEMPCAMSDVQRKNEDNFFVASCVQNDVVYVVLFGIPPKGSPASVELSDYDHNLATATKDAESQVEELVFQHRYPAFRANPVPGQIHYMFAVNYHPERPVVMIAAETRKGQTPLSRQQGVRDNCQKFLSSLEIIAQ